MAEALPVRVGDADRRRVDDRLMHAVGDGMLTLEEYEQRAGELWSARTRTELDALVADLPGDAAAMRAPAAEPAGPMPPRRVVAVMSEDRFEGTVRAGQDVSGVAVMGEAVLDLRREDLPDGTRVTARAVMGEVKVLVPPGSHVELSGVSVMGERKVEVAAGDGPTVHVHGVAVMGSVKVGIGDGRVLPAGGGAPAVSSVRTPARRTGELAERSPGRSTRRAKRIAATAVLAGAAVGFVAASPNGVSVFGSREVAVPGGSDSVSVGVLFGSTKVVVPDDVVVDQSGLIGFGSVNCKAACTAPGSASRPVVHVRAIGGFGSVRIVRQSEVEQDDG